MSHINEYKVQRRSKPAYSSNFKLNYQILFIYVMFFIDLSSELQHFY